MPADEDEGNGARLSGQQAPASIGPAFGWLCAGTRAAYTLRAHSNAARTPAAAPRFCAPPAPSAATTHCIPDGDTMLNWLFKKYGVGRAAAPPPGSTRATKPRNTAATAAIDEAQVQAQRAAKDNARAAQAAARTAEDWPGQLQRAVGDDTALLHLANTAPGLDTKLAAVQALTGEDALRQAERAFRTRDRKVHRLAKARLDTAVTQRTARTTAEQLLQRGEALLQDALLPVNHLVALDRHWQALPAALLEPTQHTTYTALRARLDAAVRERGDAEQALQRWTAQARHAVAGGPAALAAAAALPADAAREALDQLRNSAQVQRAERPAHGTTDALDAALASLLHAADQALAVLNAPPPEPATSTATADTAAANLATDAADAVAAQPAGGPKLPRERPATAEQCQQFAALLDEADTALADGQLAALQRHLQAADALLAANKRSTWPAALRARQQSLRAEHLRLKSWQSWGGTRARDDLIAEAEALARIVQPLFGSAQAVEAPAATAAAHDSAPAPAEDAATATDAAAQPATLAADEVATGPSEPATALDQAPAEAPKPTAAATALLQPRAKLNLRDHAATIHDLRMRWKALDKLGEGAHGALWQRFDAALTVAHEPVAAQHAAQQAARQQNLATRQGLLDALDAVALPEAMDGDMLAAWREPARALDAFQQAWRQLGPLEHTVPADARKALQQRLDTAIERLEQPLRSVREQAVVHREQLIAHVQGLVPTDGRAPHGGELQRQLRELQADWQDHARALPLPRGVEGALWNRFRAATDAVFAQRNAASAAREAEQAAEVTEREALIDRLAALDAQAGVPNIERTLAEVHRAWLAAPAQLPRATGLALQARFDAATAAAAALTAAACQARWQAQMDAWIAPLQVAAAPSDDPAITAPPATSSPIDDLLLQLEIALDLPAAPEWQAARRQLKLRALKEAMEGRTPPAGGAAPAARWLATLRDAPGLNAQQRQRLLAVLQTLRTAPPGTLGLAVPAD